MGKFVTMRTVAWLLIGGLIIYGLLTHPERLLPWSVKATPVVQPIVLPKDARIA
jgi:hypothetical protein